MSQEKKAPGGGRAVEVVSGVEIGAVDTHRVPQNGPQANGENRLLQAALTYARQGWHVFPLRPRDKRPITPNGLHDATTDPATIREWWSRWPDANIGINCGASGLVVLDFDATKPDFQGGDLLARLREEAPTATAITGGGGWHLLYLQPDGVKLSNARGDLPAGVDVRGHGGYIVAPPSVHPSGTPYRWEPKTPPPAPLPDFALELLLRPRKAETVATQAPAGGKGSAYARAAFERELGRLATAREGERNETLNRAAFALGQLVAGGELDRAEVEAELEWVALAIGLTPRETKATIRSGLEAGAKEPRTAPLKRPAGAERNGTGEDVDIEALVDASLITRDELERMAGNEGAPILAATVQEALDIVAEIAQDEELSKLEKQRAARERLAGLVPRLPRPARAELVTALAQAGIYTKTEAREFVRACLPTQAGGVDGGRDMTPARDVIFAQGLALELFTDPTGTAFASWEVDGHLVTHALRTGPVRGYLAELYRQERGGLPGTQAIQDAIAALEYEASRTVRPVYLRAAHVDGVTWIDLGGPDWKAIRVAPDGWTIVERPPVRFKRAKGFGRLPTPEPGTLADLEALLHVERQDLPLVAAWAIAALSGMGPFPILALTGEQGTAKSTTARLLKRLVDPATAELRGTPKEVRDLMIAAFNSWVLAFDNISFLDPEMSDALCRIATGGGYATRQLYTDAEELLIDVKRPIVMNGIGDIVARPDLQDRAIIVELPLLAEEERLPETMFWARAERLLPKALGFLLDALAYALGKLPHTKLDRLPRMADFAKLAEAAGPMLGLEPGDFLDLYDANREAGTLAVLEQSPIVEPLRALVRVSGEWEGTPTELLDALDGLADERAKADRRWPGNARALSAELKRMAPALRAADVVDVRFHRTKAARMWKVKRLSNC